MYKIREDKINNTKRSVTNCTNSETDINEKGPFTNTFLACTSHLHVNNIHYSFFM